LKGAAAFRSIRPMKTLNEVVLDALDLHASYRLPRPDFGRAKLRLVVASGNALPTGQIVFQGEPCVFADEGQYENVLRANRGVDSAVVISASGEKHAPVIVRRLLRRRLPVRLLTCAAESSAAKLLPADRVFVTRKNEEPITYNTSTYLGMILARTRENPARIKQHLLQRVRPLIPRFRRYAAFYLLLPARFDLVRPMFITKFDELFGPRVTGRCYTLEQTLHAKTVVPWDKELFISLGVENRYFGTRRLAVPLPADADFAAMVATGYYVIGHIQQQFPPWFMRHAERYAQFQKRLPFG
jgi:hypothetical protein